MVRRRLREFAPPGQLRRWVAYTVMKRILQSFMGAMLLIILNLAVLAFAPTDGFTNGTITARPRWVEVIAFPLQYGVRINKRFLSPEANNSWALIRWSDLVASFVGAFLFFGILTYLFLVLRSRRLSAT
jgi:hypothetical protein